MPPGGASSTQVAVDGPAVVCRPLQLPAGLFSQLQHSLFAGAGEGQATRHSVWGKALSPDLGTEIEHHGELLGCSFPVTVLKQIGQLAQAFLEGFRVGSHLGPAVSSPIALTASVKASTMGVKALSASVARPASPVAAALARRFNTKTYSEASCWLSWGAWP